MSLRQWFNRKNPLNKKKNKTASTNFNDADVLFYTQIDPEKPQSLEEKFWVVVFACALALFFLPIIYLIPRIHDLVNATTWVTTEDIETTDDVGAYGNIVLNSSNLPDAVFYDKTNRRVRWATRSAGGTWAAESIETLPNEYNFGNTNNIKMGIAIDPTDNKPSVLYCNYGYGGGAANSQLRFAHRVGGGAGNCGTSNNWTCSSVGDISDSCGMRMVTLGFHVTSSQPIASYSQDSGAGTRIKYAEYDGSAWTITTIAGNESTGYYDLQQTALSFTTSSEPVIFFPRQYDGSIDQVMYSYRRASDWAWQTPVVVDSVRHINAPATFMSATKDSNGYIWATYSTAYGGLSYAKLIGGTLTTSTLDQTVSSTWNSIAIINSNPAVAWYDSTNSDLKYSIYTAGIWTGETVSSTGDVGQYAALASTGGLPFISYYDRTNGNASFISATAFNTAPTAPTVPYSNSTTAQSGLANPTNLATSTPAFSALFNDADGSDTGQKAEIQVTTSTDGFATVTHWESGASGNTYSPNTTNGARSIDFGYNNFGSAATKSISFPDDGTEGGTNTTYYWRIRFWDASVAGTWSATATFSILDLPAAPSSLLAPLSETSAVASWTDNSSIERSFALAQSTDNSTYTHAATSSANVATATASTLIPNTLYYFKVRAYNLAGYSSYSTATSGYTLANIPATVMASSSAYDRVSLSWSANSNSAGTEYDVLNVTASTNSGFAAGTNATITGLQGAKSYTFQVRARNSALINTSYSSVATTTTLPNDPASLTATQSGTSVVLAWSANGNSASANYIVENITTGLTSGLISATTYTFTGLTTGSTYQFRVKAYNSDSMASGYSGTTSITLTASSSGSAGGAASQGRAEQQAQQQAIIADAMSGAFTISSIDNGVTSKMTSSTQVYLNLTYSANVTDMMVSNQPGFDGESWIKAQQKTAWNIIGGTGTRTVYVKFRSKKLNTSDVFAQSITLDQVAPAVPTIASPTMNEKLTTEKISYSGTGESQSHIILTLHSTVNGVTVSQSIGDVVVDERGAWSYDAPIPLATGNYSVYVTSFDAAGNNAKSAMIRFSVVDNTPPATPDVLLPEQHGVVEGGLFSTNGFAEPNTKIIIVRDNILTYQAETQLDGTWKYHFVVPLGVGTHSLEYTAIDSSSNQSAKRTILFSVTGPIIAAPIIPDLPIVQPPASPSPIISQKPHNPKPAFFDQTASAPTGKSIAGGTANVSSSPDSPTNSTSDSSGAAISDGIITLDPKSQIDIVAQSSNESVSSGILKNAAAVVNAAYDRAQIVARQTAVSAKRAARVVKQVAETPQVQATNKIVVVPTTSAIAIASVGGAVNSSQYLIYLKYLFTQPFSLLRRRRRKGWGTVYNALTKLPVDLAVVRIVDAKSNRVVQSRVTDRMGRYQFFVQPGEYAIESTKQDFSFPPVYMKGRTEDGRYTDVYAGGALALEQPTAVRYNIPLDPAGMEKPASQILREAAKKRFAQIASLGGVIMTGVSFAVTPTPIVGAFLVGHIGSYFVFRRLALGKKPNNWGVVYDAETKLPVAKAIVRIFDTQYNKLLETQVTDDKGRYAFLVGKNTYYVMAEHQGHQKFVSQPVEIREDVEGSAVAPDVMLKVESVLVPETLSSVPVTETPAIAEAVLPSADSVQPQQQPVSYAPKAIVPLHVDAASDLSPSILFKKISSENNNSTPIAEALASKTQQTEQFVVFKKIEQQASAQRKIAPLAIAHTNTSGLLAPISLASRKLIITGLPHDIDELPELINDGNFLPQR